VIAPRGAEPVDQRLLAVRMLGHDRDREVRGREGIHEGEERERHKRELRQRRRLGQLHPRPDTPRRAHHRQARLRQGHHQREHECVVTEFGDHVIASMDSPARNSPSRSCLARPSTSLLATSVSCSQKLVDGRTKSDHDE
jgi:hypothetical protein